MTPEDLIDEEDMSLENTLVAFGSAAYDLRGELSDMGRVQHWRNGPLVERHTIRHLVGSGRKRYAWDYDDNSVTRSVSMEWR